MIQSLNGTAPVEWIAPAESATPPPPPAATAPAADDALSGLIMGLLRAMPPADLAALIDRATAPAPAAPAEPEKPAAPPAPARAVQEKLRHVPGFGDMPPRQSYNPSSRAACGWSSAGGRTVTLTVPDVEVAELGSATAWITRLNVHLDGIRDAVKARPRMAARVRQVVDQVIDLETPERTFPLPRHNRVTTPIKGQ